MTATSRALVVKLSSMGDLFHPLPAVHQLKRALNATVDWVTQPEYHDLVACFSDVDRVLDFPRRNFVSGFPSFIRKLRHVEYDYIFDFQGLFKSGMTTRMARAKRRIGPAYYREGASIYYDEISGRRDKNRHAVEEALDFVRHMGAEPTPPIFPVRFPDVDPGGGGVRIALAPCSRWETKNWPPEHFIALAKQIRDALPDTTFYLIGGSQDQTVCAQIAAALKERVVDLSGKTTLPELGGYLTKMDLLITVDSGPMHMASALRVPVMAIFGSTDPRRTGPYGDRQRVVQHGGLACQPCRSRVCTRPGADLACMRELTPDKVARAVLDMEGWQQEGNHA